jgi:hypothetical protein
MYDHADSITINLVNPRTKAYLSSNYDVIHHNVISYVSPIFYKLGWNRVLFLLHLSLSLATTTSSFLSLSLTHTHIVSLTQTSLSLSLSPPPPPFSLSNQMHLSPPSLTPSPMYLMHLSLAYSVMTNFP